jgi:hypothetical protein
MEVIILSGNVRRREESWQPIIWKTWAFSVSITYPPDCSPISSPVYPQLGLAYSGYEPDDMRRMAFVIDVAQFVPFQDIVPSLKKLTQRDVHYQVIFLEASVMS